jgi:dUTP diphosphatase
VKINLSNEEVLIESGERICQMVIAKHEQADLIQVEILNKTDRGAGGFGSTGVK